MNTQHAIESIAAAIYSGDMSANEARAVNSGDGFTIDHSAGDDGSFSRTEGVRLSTKNLERAISLAAMANFGMTD